MLRHSTSALAALATSLLSSCCAQAPTLDRNLSVQLRATAGERAAAMEALVTPTSLPGVVVATVPLDGETEFLSFGRHGLGDPAPMTPDSLFEIQSMTKAFTATAVLQLVERGVIGLDDPLEEVMPELRQIEILVEDGTRRPPTRPLTMRDLLRHTSGFAYFFTSPAILAEVKLNPITGMPLPDKIEAGEYDWGFDIQPRRIFDAGEAWVYGRGLGVAARVVERLSGDDLDSYFKAHIFGPLGLDSTGYNLPESLMERRVTLHTRIPGTGALVPMPDLRPRPMERFYGGGSLLSTPRDYARFLRCLLNGGELDGVRILGEDMVALMTSDQLPDGVRVKLDPIPGADTDRTRTYQEEYDDGYSLSWAIEVGGEDGRRPEGVGYWSGLFNTYYTIDPARGLAVLSFSQLLPFDDVEAYELYRAYEDLVYQAVLEPGDGGAE
ncbi:MAG: serine hydrolase [Planctomycetota bacterium]|nr:serine hydrolase [Planctomycetota bacterium]MDG1984569.1 serine hydrolase [Planctomycetota bacterium]